MESVKMKVGDQNVRLDTNGRCFFCSNPVPVKLIIRPNNNRESGSFPAQSLQCLSRYLKLGDNNNKDDGNAVSSAATAWHHLLEKLPEPKLKVELCQECSPLNQKFSEVFQQLEKANMEVTVCLKLILIKLEKAWADDIAEDFQKLAMPRSKTPVEVRLLREKVVEKSCLKLSRFRSPRIQIQDMTLDEVEEEKLKHGSSMATRSTDGIIMGPPVLDGEDDGDWEPDDPNPHHHKDSMEDEGADEKFKSEGKKRKLEISDDDNEGAPLMIPGRRTVIRRDLSKKCITNPKTGRTKCTDCSREFPQRRAFQNHYRRAHLHVRYQCPICSKIFKDYGGYVYHRNSAHLKIRHECKTCKKTFVKLKDHLQTSRCGKGEEFMTTHRCKICQKEFTNPRSLQLHMKGVHLKIRDIICEKCGKGFAAHSYLRQHLRTCSGTSSETTAVPVKKEVADDITDTHTNDGDSPARGVEADDDDSGGGGGIKMEGAGPSGNFQLVTLTRGINLPKLHMKDKYTVDDVTGEFVCKLCPNKKCPSLGSIHHHLKKDHFKLRFKCSDCDKTFASRDVYVQHHDLVHLGVKFKCDNCDKLFRWEASLYDHIRKGSCRDEGDDTPKPVGRFKCQLCGRAFWRSSRLASHMKQVHWNIKDSRGLQPVWDGILN